MRQTVCKQGDYFHSTFNPSVPIPVALDTLLLPLHKGAFWILCVLYLSVCQCLSPLSSISLTVSIYLSLSLQFVSIFLTLSASEHLIFQVSVFGYISFFQLLSIS